MMRGGSARTLSPLELLVENRRRATGDPTPGGSSFCASSVCLPRQKAPGLSPGWRMERSLAGSGMRDNLEPEKEKSRWQPTNDHQRRS